MVPVMCLGYLGLVLYGTKTRETSGSEFQRRNSSKAGAATGGCYRSTYGTATYLVSYSLFRAQDGEVHQSVIVSQNWVIGC